MCHALMKKISRTPTRVICSSRFVNEDARDWEYHPIALTEEDFRMATWQTFHTEIAVKRVTESRFPYSNATAATVFHAEEPGVMIWKWSTPSSSISRTGSPSVWDCLRYFRL